MRINTSVSIFKNGIGRDLRLWPMLSLLLIVVLTPTACLLWFMNRAIENERLAMRKTLEDAYRRDLSDAQTRLDTFWKNRIAAITKTESDQRQPAVVFAQCVRSGWADSAVCYDGQGRVIYPAAPISPPNQTAAVTSEWEEAWRLENSENNPAAAATAYASIARETSDLNLAALALQAQARCLVQSGNRQAAIELITDVLAEDKYSSGCRSSRTPDRSQCPVDGIISDRQ